MSLLSRPLVADTIALAFGTFAETTARLRRLDTSGPATDVSTIRVPTRHGTVACTVYRGAGGSGGAAPVYVNLHGGAFVIGYPEQDDRWCRHLAGRCGVTVLNVAYSTAPRRRFPVAIEQALDVVTWAADATGQPGDRGWDGTRLAVGGQSAGGNLAAAVARLARSGRPRIGAAPGGRVAEGLG